MITLYGTTSDGTSIPVEVTDDGKLVIDTSSLSGYIKQGDNITAGTINSGSITSSGAITVAEKVTASGRITTSADIYVPSATGDAGIALYNSSGNSSSYFAVAISDNSAGTPKSITLSYDGHITAAKVFCGSITSSTGKAGFTTDGELFFWSRGARYKAVVSNGLISAEDYPVSRALEDKAQDKRDPRI